MKIILKPVFEFLTGDIIIYDNVIYNYIVLVIIGIIAYTVAWNTVGQMYGIGLIDGRIAGSIIHWVIRFVVFISICAIFVVALWVYKLILITPLWVWLMFVGVITGITLIIIFIRKMKSK